MVAYRNDKKKRILKSKNKFLRTIDFTQNYSKGRIIGCTHGR